MELSWQRAICMPPHCHCGLWFFFFFFQLEAIRSGFWKDTKPVLTKPQPGHFKAPEHMRRWRGALYFLFPPLRHVFLSACLSPAQVTGWRTGKTKINHLIILLYFASLFLLGYQWPWTQEIHLSLIFVVKKIFLCDSLPYTVVVGIIIVH